MVSTPLTQAATPAAEPYRVMVVDDSAVIRGLLTRALEADPSIRVVSSVGDGQMALNALARQPIDVIVLDIEMPVMDGMTALPRLIAASPHTKVIMASTLTARNADISLRALAAGAADYVAKPSSSRDLSAADVFKRELVTKVTALGAAARKDGGASLKRAYAARPLAPRAGGAATGPREAAQAARLRPMPTAAAPEVIGIGSSTGGPQALFQVLSHLRGFRQPILVTQHMPATFTAILAEHIRRQCGLDTVEPTDGDPVVGGRCYIAPGDFHMTVRGGPGDRRIRISQDAPENFCRPAVDPMMRSLVASYGARMVAVILTGMGQDGMRGCRDVARSGGVVVAQDEATSVVWGMPGAVAADGTCNAILPVNEIGPFVRKLSLRTAA